MGNPKCRRFYRHYDDFNICVNIGEKGYVIAENPNERFTIFYYGPYGKGRFGRIFSNEYIELNSENIMIDLQDYVHDSIIFEATEDFYLIGFNTLDKNIKWGYEILDKDCIDYKLNNNINKKSFFLCLNGNISINDKEFKRYNYSAANNEKKYDIKFLKENSILGLFYQL